MANDKVTPQTDPEQQRLRKEEQARRTRRRGRQLLGLALAVLIVVGAVSIVQRGIELVDRMMQSSEDELLEYQERVKFPVYFDMLPFENLEQIDHNILKECGIWAYLDQQGFENVPQDGEGRSLVPTLEVERYVASLLGPDFSLAEHAEFTDTVQGLTYGYDSQNEAYLVPGTSLQPDFTPRVMEIVNESGGVKRVIVGYVATIGNNNEIIDTPDWDRPARFMDFVFQRDGSEYYLVSLQRNTTYVVADVSGTDAASSQTGSSASTSGSVPALVPPASQVDGDGSQAGQEDASVPEETPQTEDTSTAE